MNARGGCPAEALRAKAGCLESPNELRLGKPASDLGTQKPHYLDPSRDSIFATPMYARPAGPASGEQVRLWVNSCQRHRMRPAMRFVYILRSVPKPELLDVGVRHVSVGRELPTCKKCVHPGLKSPQRRRQYPPPSTVRIRTRFSKSRSVRARVQSRGSLASAMCCSRGPSVTSTTTWPGCRSSMRM